MTGSVAASTLREMPNAPVDDPADPLAVIDDPAPAPPAPSTPAQQERYTRILDTTLAILDEAGPYGLQMRDVAKRADVALATLYRYFPSRDYLIAMALDRWSAGMATRLGRHGVSSRHDATGSKADTGTDLTTALRSVARAFADHPNYATASILAAGSADPLVTTALRTYRSSFANGLGIVLDGLPEQQRSDVAFIIESVLSSQLVGFSSGRTTRAHLEAALERAVRILDLGDPA